MVGKKGRFIRMDDPEFEKLSRLAEEFKVPLGVMINAMVDDARQRKAKFFVSDAYLIPDDKLAVIVRAVSCLASFLEQQEGLDDSREYLKLARKRITEAEFSGGGIEP